MSIGFLNYILRTQHAKGIASIALGIIWATVSVINTSIQICIIQTDAKLKRCLSLKRGGMRRS